MTESTMVLAYCIIDINHLADYIIDQQWDQTKFTNGRTLTRISCDIVTNLLILHLEWMHIMLDGGPICLLMDRYIDSKWSHGSTSAPREARFWDTQVEERGTNGDFPSFFVILSMAELG
jgi:hypothetical protein